MPLTPYHGPNRTPGSWVSFKLALGLGIVCVLGACYALVQGWWFEAAMIGGFGLVLAAMGVMQHPTWSEQRWAKVVLIVGLLAGLMSWVTAILTYF